MVTVNEQKYLDILLHILKEYCYDGEYSLDGYLENAICLQKDNEVWEVYCGERNNHYSSEKYSNILECCIAFIRKVGEKDKIQIMLNKFSELIMDSNSTEIAS